MTGRAHRSADVPRAPGSTGAVPALACATGAAVPWSRAVRVLGRATAHATAGGAR